MGLLSQIKDWFKSLPGTESLRRWSRVRAQVEELREDVLYLHSCEAMQTRYRVNELDGIVHYLVSEVSQLRRIVRHLAADHPMHRKTIAQTAGSFDFQWDQLPDSEFLLTDDSFRESVTERVCEFTALEPEWFQGKRVLDAGCGNGRFSWAMARLGAKVTAVDISAHGLDSLARIAARDDLDVTVRQHNLLEPLPFDEPFDLVWSFGVLHHTGDTYRAFQNLCPMVKLGGYLFLMLYGEPRWEVPGDYVEQNHYQRLRALTQNKSLSTKIDILRQDPVVNDVHGWFDAVSPLINDLYSFDELETWLLDAGFDDICKTLDTRNHHLSARRVRPVRNDAGATVNRVRNIAGAF